jgi:hypothetical protein
VLAVLALAASMLASGSASAHVVTCDFTTGGGWVLIPNGTASGSAGLPESGDKANFGIVGGCKNGGFYGHANYVDHNNGLHVNGPVTAYLDPCIDVGGCGQRPGYRDLCGPAKSDLGDVFFRIRTRDNGKPEGNDRFGIKLVLQSDPVNVVYLVPTRQLGPPPPAHGGGKIQFHFPNPSNTGPNPPPDEFTACHMDDSGLGQ